LRAKWGWGNAYGDKGSVVDQAEHQYKQYEDEPLWQDLGGKGRKERERERESRKSKPTTSAISNRVEEKEKGTT
jgi:hypothetical protein